MDIVNVVKRKYLCFLKNPPGGDYAVNWHVLILKTPFLLYKKKIFKNPSLPIYFGL